MKNWKTSLAGVLVALPMALHMLFPSTVTIEVATAISTLFVAAGLTAAKDYNVSGKPPESK